MVRSRHTSRTRRWFATVTALALIAVAGLVPATSVAAAEPDNMVLVWNEHALNAIGNAPTAATPGLGQPPPLAPIHLAMVHGAVYDAVNAIDGRYEPYLDGLPGASASASRAAAVATAAHGVLVGLVNPTTHAQVKASLDSKLAASLGQITNNQRKADGIAIGAAAASGMLAERTGDGRFGTTSFVVGDEIGEWVPVPPTSNNVFAWIKDVEPFTLTDQDQFRTDGPFDLGSPEYAAEFNEVKALGAKTGSSRTAAQTLLAHFVSSNPVPMLNRGLRDIADHRDLSTADQARLFARTTMSAADALIGCWDDKYRWHFWRPYTAIRNASLDGNSATTQQDDWESLFSPPGYPEHPSGYNCFTGATMHAAKAFFKRDEISFELTSPGTNPPTTTATRSYTRFTDVVQDAIDGRICMGIHFRTPDVQGAELGQNVAEWVAANYFAPVD